MEAMTSAEANDALAKGLRELHRDWLQQLEDRKRATLLSSLKSPFMAFFVICGLGIIITLVAEAALGHAPAWFFALWGVEIFLLAFSMFVLYIWLRATVEILGMRHLAVKLMLHIEELEKMREESHSTRGEYDSFFNESEDGPTIIYVLRDDTWKTIPVVFLVEGDIVKLMVGQISPCVCTEVPEDGGDGRVLNRGDKVQPRTLDNDSDSSKNEADVEKEESDGQVPMFKVENVRMRVKEIPVVTMLKVAMERQLSEEKPSEELFLERDKPVDNAIQKLMEDKVYRASPFAAHIKNYFALCFLCFVVAWLTLSCFNLARYFYQDQADSWAVLIVLRPAYACLPFIPISSISMFILLNGWANIHMLSIYEELCRGVPSQFTPVAYGEEAFEEEAPDKYRHEFAIPFQEAVLRFMRMINGNDDRLYATSPVGLAVGLSTVVCGLQQDGVMFDSVAPVEKIYIPNERGDVLDLEVERAVGRGENHSRMETYSLAFRSQQAKDQHINSLKALGLNVLVNSGCRWVQPSDIRNRCGHPVFELFGGFLSCQCIVGRDIGFTPEAIDAFNHVQDIHTLVPAEALHERVSKDKNVNDSGTGLRYLSQSSIVVCIGEAMQLLSRGDAEMVLRSCTDVFDGTSLRPLSPDDIGRLLQVASMWTAAGYSCTTFSYRPLPPKYSGLYVPKRDDPSQENEWRSNGGDEEGTGTGKADSIEVDGESESQEIPDSGERSTPSLVDQEKVEKESAGGQGEDDDEVIVESDDNKSEPSEVQRKPKVPAAVGKSYKQWEKKRDAVHRYMDSNMQTVYYSLGTGYTTNPANSVPFSMYNDDTSALMLKSLEQNQILIGMTGMRTKPRAEAVKVVETLQSAGIRFVCISEKDRLVSVSYADALGLETDWNTSISLSTPERHDKKIVNDQTPSQLPRGIPSIVRHIEEIDNVPLLVPLFYNASVKTTGEMLDIFQEYGDIACCFGSRNKSANADIFLHANWSATLSPPEACCRLATERNDFSQSMDRPGRRGRSISGKRKYKPGEGGQQGVVELELDEEPKLQSLDKGNVHSVITMSSEEQSQLLANRFLSLTCPFNLSKDLSLCGLLDMIFEGRKVSDNVIYALLFWIEAHLGLGLLLFLSNLFMCHNLLQGYQILWLMLVIIPVLSMTHLLTPVEVNIMTRLAAKNIVHYSFYRRFAKFTVYRYFPIALVCIAIYQWTLVELWNGGASDTIFGFGIPTVEAVWTNQFLTAQLFAQNVVLFAFVLYLCIRAVMVLQVKGEPLSAMFWRQTFGQTRLFLVFSMLLLQIVFFVASIACCFSLFGDVPFGVYIILFGWTIFLVLTEIHIYNKFKAWRRTYQLQLKLEFDTKLGMYSPVSSPVMMSPNIEH